MKKSIIILATSFVVFFLALFMVTKLEIISNMEDMLPSDSESMKASLEFNKHFDGQDQAIVVIKYKDDSDLNEALAQEFTSELASNLKNEPYIQSLLYKINMGEIMPYAWAYVDFEKYEDMKKAMDSDDFSKMQGILKDLQKDLESADEHTQEYLTNEDKTHYMIIVKPNIDGDDFMAMRGRFYEGVHENINRLLNKEKYKSLEAGLTGGVFIQDIEADTAAFEGLFGTMAITLILILLVLIIFFKGLKLPLLSVYPLLLGAVLAAASAYIIYGSLNMFSVSFALLLLGLGIDFAVHLLTRYQEERARGLKLYEAVKISQKSTGGSIIFGAATTAFAFASFAFAKFKAFEQMGIISAVGLVFLCISMLVLIPEIIRVFDRKRKRVRKQINMNWLGNLTKASLNRPYLIIVFLVLVTISLVTFVKDTKIETNITAVYPDDIASLKWAGEVENAFDYNTDTITIYADNDQELFTAVNNLSKSDDIEKIDSIFDYMPKNMDDKLDIILNLDMMLKSKGIDAFKELKLEEMTIHDLPNDIKRNYIGDSGKIRAEIIPSIDIYDREKYDNLMVSVDDEMGRRPTGMPTLFNEITKLVKEDILKISTICFLAVFILGWIIFKKARHGFLTVIPLALTIYITLGLLPIFNIEINVFSIAAFPLVIGIGIDSSIHLLHRLNETSELSIPEKVKNTGLAIILTGITTIIGFGSLSLINHPGMANLGLTVVVGIFVCIILTLTVIPVGYISLNKSDEKNN